MTKASHRCGHGCFRRFHSIGESDIQNINLPEESGDVIIQFIDIVGIRSGKRKMKYSFSRIPGSLWKNILEGSVCSNILSSCTVFQMDSADSGKGMDMQGSSRRTG